MLKEAIEIAQMLFKIRIDTTESYMHTLNIFKTPRSSYYLVIRKPEPNIHERIFFTFFFHDGHSESLRNSYEEGTTFLIDKNKDLKKVLSLFHA